MYLFEKLWLHRKTFYQIYLMNFEQLKVFNIID